MTFVLQAADSASRLAGGMFESIRGLSMAIEQETCWRVGMVAVQDKHYLDDKGLWGEIPLHMSSAQGFAALGGSLAMTRFIRDLSPDVLHLNGIWGPASMAAARVKQGQSRPRLILSPHGMLEPWALRQSKFKKNVAWAIWMKQLLDQVDCLHALCEEERDALRALAPNHPIAIIPNGVHLPAKSVIDGQRRKEVLFLGRIHPKKGLTELIDAWSLSDSAHANGWRLIIAGWDDGGHEALLKEQVKSLGLSESIEFFGPAFSAAKEQLFRQASIFALPSFSEGLPMAVLEAWSYGLPVLMTAECHLSIGFERQAAVRCDPNPASIASSLTAMLTTMDEDERQTMGARGRALVEERFVWNRLGQDIASVYDWLIGGPKPSIVEGELRDRRQTKWGVRTITTPAVF